MDASSTPRPARPNKLEGRVLGDFVVRDRIGQGGFAAVYRAEQPLLAREAVIKVLHARHRSSEPVIQRFLREAKLASRLDHPYAAHIYAFGAEPDGLLWIAMELVRGTPLDKLLREGPLPLERFVPLLDRLCEVIHTAHEAGIVHRDIKPANVMVLSRAGRLYPKLLDLGIAKLADGAPPPGESGSFDECGRPVELADTRLTQGGAVIGSPFYMAPEQWTDATATDARADLYALGVLTFEALTGRVPFDEVGLDALARAHAEAPVPLLGPGLSSGLDAVLARALAKTPAQRFASSLEFAAAFRAAAGLDGERAQLPRLDEVLRDAVLADAPQPIAEAVAGLDGAKSAHQARDALWEVVHVAVRWLALVALACRTRLGTEAAPAVGDALRTLARRALTDEEWLELARELVRPFSTRRDAHPIPELVDACAADAPPFHELLAARAEHAAPGTEEQVREQVARLVPALAASLRRLAFLSDYPLVVARGATVERWMGVRRARRAPAAVRTPRPLPASEPVLLDREGRPVVRLSPLVQVGPPAPGETDELFLLEGPRRLRRGARLVAAPLGFERHDETLWSWFGQHLLDVVDDGAARDEARAPYRGLAPFTAADAADFHGREQETIAFVNRLRTTPLLAVVGPSGAGKSSFVQAGVIPSLPAGWRAVVIRPGATPLATLRARFAPAPDETTLLVVDQLEELFTLCRDPDERVRFAEALAAAATSVDDPVRVVCTVRDDFLIRVGELSPLRERLGRALHVLTTPLPEDLLRILVEPARRVGYEFEDRELPSRMVAEVSGKPGALALLSFTASRLWELRDRHFKQLPRRAYDALGGVGGALGRHAEETLAQLLPDEQKLVREAFRHLVTAEGTRAVLSRNELTDVLGGEAVLEKLVAARLLVVSDDGAVEIIHEALLGAWPRLVAWRREDAEGARLRDQLRAAARQWDERGRPSGLLWRNEALTEYQIWRARYPGSLTSVEEAFGAASLADAARGRRRRRLALGAAFAGLVAALAVLYVMHDRAEVQRARAVASGRESTSRLAALYAEQGRQRLLANDALGAVVYLDEAHRRGHDTPALRWLVARALRMLDRELVTLAGHTAFVRVAWFDPAGARVVTSGGDGTARIWDAATGTELAVLRAHGGTVLRADFVAGGERAFTHGDDGVARLWDTATGSPIATLGEPGARVRHVGQSPDGTRLVTASSDGVVRLWDARSGALVSTIAHGSDARASQFDPSGARLATAGGDGVVTLWDSATGRALGSIRAHRGPVFQVAFSPDGSRLVTTGGPSEPTLRLFSLPDGVERAAVTDLPSLFVVRWSGDGARFVAATGERVVRVYDGASAKLQLTLRHDGPVAYACFSPDGARIATTSADGTVNLWHADSGTRLATLAGHADTVYWASFDPDGRRLVTTGLDATARIWHVGVDDLLLTLPHDGPVASAAFDPRGRAIVTTDDSGAVRIWDARTGAAVGTVGRGAAPAPFAVLAPDGGAVAFADGDALVVLDVAARREVARLPHPAAVAYAAFAPDGRTLVTAGTDGVARIWDLAARRVIRSYSAHGGALTSVAVSADGRLVATGSDDRSAHVWEAATGRSVVVLGGHLRAVRAVGFSGDGARVATASDRTARVWRVADGALLTSFRGHSDEVASVEISPDGHFVLTASDDGTALISDAATGDVLGVMGPHGDYVTRAAFSPDGTRVLTASRDGSAKIWSVAPGSATRDREELARRAACAPFAVVDGRLLPTAPRPCALAREAQPAALGVPPPPAQPPAQPR